MEIIDVDCLVVGAGVVGLAVARELCLQGKEVLLLEKESSFGMQTSSRNSEVIHAGIYYPEGSLKAQLCVRGKQLLYAYCVQNKILFNNCGKLIVASGKEQELKLRQIAQHARANGVEDLEWLDKAALFNKEPELSASAALFSPSTGILDSHAFMLQLQADIESNGGCCIFNSSLSFDCVTSKGIQLILNDNEAIIHARECINACGLSAIPLLKNFEGFPKSKLPKAHFAKGSYFSYSARTPFSHLVYPIPENGGLGVHLTLDLQGSARFGPDVEWLDNNFEGFDYKVDEAKVELFKRSIQSYWPEIDAAKLIPAYSGIRPKISGFGQPSGDFLIQGESQHGISGLVNLFGIESPGLTSSLAIAEKVRDLIINN